MDRFIHQCILALVFLHRYIHISPRISFFSVIFYLCDFISFPSISHLMDTIVRYEPRPIYQLHICRAPPSSTQLEKFTVALSQKSCKLHGLLQIDTPSRPLCLYTNYAKVYNRYNVEGGYGKDRELSSLPRG
jgi:hypothetical protein